MHQKRGKKRKAATGGVNGHVDSDDSLTLPDRSTWPGWVEMESEPALFNVMLKEMKVQGIKVHEVYGLDENLLALLPKPVHAFIFLFRYRDSDHADQQSGSSPDYIWFANQIPEFACATVALLNIVNNIPGLNLGEELRTFKEFTANMDPISRGDAIDSFEFVKRIHNSFARENDLLQADMSLQEKVSQARRKEATAKARATRLAKKATLVEDNNSPNNSAVVSCKISLQDGNGLDGENAPTKSSDLNPRDNKGAKSDRTVASSQDNDEEFKSKAKMDVDVKDEPRRSNRRPKPRKNSFAVHVDEDDDGDEGYHFIAYMPIEGKVWKLDGLNRYPNNLGQYTCRSSDFEITPDWIRVAQPAIVDRMAQFEGAEIEFNLMAVVHDPAVEEKQSLLGNVKALQAIDRRLGETGEDWKSMVGGETPKDVITGESIEFDITQANIDLAEMPPEAEAIVSDPNDWVKLIEERSKVVGRQAVLRAGVRDGMASCKEDEGKARHRRHNYSRFLRSWLDALAESELLDDLVSW